MATSKYRAQHEEDIKTLGELIREFAKKYDLCEDGLEDFMDTANRKLNVPLSVKPAEQECHFHFRLTRMAPVVNEDGYRYVDDDTDRAITDEINKALKAAGLAPLTFEDSYVN